MREPWQDFRSAWSVQQGTLIIRFDRPHRTLSSAVLGGGLCDANYVLNHQLSREFTADSPSFQDPEAYLRTVAQRMGLQGRGVGLMTAVSMDRLVSRRMQSRDLWVEGFITVGTRNAVRAGDPATAFEEDGGPPTAGTINIIIVTNADVSLPAMVEMVQVATEAKTAALHEGKVISKVTGQIATGTGTDAIVIVSGHGRPVRYAGTHTSRGEMVGRLVWEGVSEGLRRTGW